MPTAKNGLQILNLHPKKHVMKKKKKCNAYLLDEFRNFICRIRISLPFFFWKRVYF